MAEKHLTADYVRETLHYDPDTGVFTWRERPRHHFKSKHTCNLWNARYAGTQAGSLTPKGYRTITFQLAHVYRGVSKKPDKYPRCAHCFVHRLAFLIMTGSFPPDRVDHINGVRDDNRWANLRHATNRENSRNRRLLDANTSGHVGVYWQKVSRKWMAQIWTDKGVVYLGLWRSKPMAALVRRYSETYYGFHPNHGRS